MLLKNKVAHFRVGTSDCLSVDGRTGNALLAEVPHSADVEEKARALAHYKEVVSCRRTNERPPLYCYAVTVTHRPVASNSQAMSRNQKNDWAYKKGGEWLFTNSGAGRLPGVCSAENGSRGERKNTCWASGVQRVTTTLESRGTLRAGKSSFSPLCLTS